MKYSLRHNGELFYVTRESWSLKKQTLKVHLPLVAASLDCSKYVTKI